MTVHMIVGITFGTEKIIEALRRRGATYIFVMDHLHEGPPMEIDGIKYYSEKEAREIQAKYPDTTLHYYRNNKKMMDLSNYYFRDS